MWDVAIVGAGPAGSAAAIAARRADPRARVLLLDKAQFPRDKVCGDGIAPHALDVLSALGVSTADLVAGCAPIATLRLRSPVGVEAARPLARAAYVVPRAIFDSRLVAAAVEAGAVLQQRRVRTLVQDPDGILIDGVIRARTVVGADGAESAVRRAAGASPALAGTVAVAIRGYDAIGNHPPGEQLLAMGREHWPAYAWVFPIGDGRANVGYGELLRSAQPTRRQLEDRMRELIPGAEPESLRGHRLPLSPGRPRLAHGRVLLAGDAASLINPLTGEGIYYAVLSGAAAGRAALRADPASAYLAAMRQALGRHLRHTDALARAVRWPRVIDAGVQAARDRQSHFDALVEVGLGAGRLDAGLTWATACRLARPGVRQPDTAVADARAGRSIDEGPESVDEA
ncbi:MAG: hypothetical protein JWN61_462 [Pseudonocardiales bacterium]|nr:hypothetical protein [Pseudonocardiales bacterium]